MLGLFQQTVMGLDIGTSSIKVVQLKETKDKKWELVNVGIAPLSKDAIEATEPEKRKAAIAATIKGLIKEKNIKAKNAAISLAGDSIIIRYIKLPFMTHEDLKKSIRAEAEQYIPLGLDQVMLDCQILSELQEDGVRKIDVLVVAAKNEFVAHNLAIMKSANLSPVVIDIDGFALENAYEISKTDDHDETVALVNVGATFTNINIVEGNVTRFNRDIPVAGNDFTKEIQREFNLSFSEAEELKKVQGSISIDDEDMGLSTIGDKDDRTLRMSDAMTPVLNKLLGELRRSFDFYETQARKKTVERIILSGGSARLKNLNRFLANKLGIPVEFMVPFRNLEIGKNFDMEFLAEKEVQFGVCLGLALRKLNEK